MLDLGCGMAEPLAAYMLTRGFHIVGIDSSASMIEMCRSRFPESEWRVADMRELSLGRGFEGILAWDSFFHLDRDAQRAMFPRFASHALPHAALMFTSGTSDGEVVGSYRDEPLYHASLEPSEYERLLTVNGFSVRAHQAEDPDCWSHTVWLATHDGK